MGWNLLQTVKWTGASRASGASKKMLSRLSVGFMRPTGPAVRHARRRVPWVPSNLSSFFSRNLGARFSRLVERYRYRLLSAFDLAAASRLQTSVLVLVHHLLGLTTALGAVGMFR